MAKLKQSRGLSLTLGCMDHRVSTPSRKKIRFLHNTSSKGRMGERSATHHLPHRRDRSERRVDKAVMGNASLTHPTRAGLSWFTADLSVGCNAACIAPSPFTEERGAMQAHCTLPLLPVDLDHRVNLDHRKRRHAMEPNGANGFIDRYPPTSLPATPTASTPAAAIFCPASDTVRMHPPAGCRTCAR